MVNCDAWLTIRQRVFSPYALKRLKGIGMTRGTAWSPPLRVTEYAPHTLQYQIGQTDCSFRHNYDRDLQIVVLWENSRNKESEIVARLRDDFEVLGMYEVEWSPDTVVRSFNRFYSKSLANVVSKHRTVGSGPFLAIVVEDPKPTYGYEMNVSGLVELCNRNISTFKRVAREAVGPGYAVHSSNNLQEFFHDSALILGPDLLAAVIGDGSPRNTRIEPLNCDLPGSAGWRDLRELFDVLKWSTPYVVLRSFDELPEALVADLGEIDILAANQKEFAAIANATKVGQDPQSGGHYCVIGGERLKLDIREVSDGYLDARWQADMLSRAVIHADIVRVPRADDYFFSLLYHAKVQKPVVKAQYRRQLPQLARLVAIPSDLADSITEDDPAATVLGGYLAARLYDIPRAADRRVHRNKRFVRLLESARVSATGRRIHRRSPAWRIRRWLIRTPGVRWAFHRLRAVLAVVRRGTR